MTKLLRNAVALLLTVVMCFSLGITAFADTFSNNFISAPLEEKISGISKAEAKKLTNEELFSGVKLASTINEANIIFDEYMSRLENCPEIERNAQVRALLDQYLRVNSVSYSRPVMTINYTILAIVPSGASLVLGYEFPAVTRTSGETIQLSGKSTGTYTKTFNVRGLICAVRASSIFTARDYSASQVYATYNYTSDRYTDYHIVSAAEAIGNWAVSTLVPGAIILMFPGSRTAKLTAKAITIGGATLSLFAAANITLGPPLPQAGYYVETVTWYENNRMYVHQRYWYSREAYVNNDLPIYDSGTYISVNIPSF